MRPSWLTLLAALAIIVALFQLERARSGLETIDIPVGLTPATLIRKPGETGPIVVIAHGFAGSRPMMQAYSFNLAQAGYTVLAFDFEGHGRNPVPMSGAIDSIDGTTALLVAETRRVIAAARNLQIPSRPVTLLGHSMATDILVRAAAAEAASGTPVGAVVAISMFSGAVTAVEPPRLLIISGQWEPRLRQAALAALRLVQPTASEGQTAMAGPVLRRAVVAPGVEHIGVLFSASAIREARDWLDAAFGRVSATPILTTGPWILLLLGGIVLLLKPLALQMPAMSVPLHAVAPARFWLAVLLPAILVPIAGTAIYRPYLPVLVAEYLAGHLAAYALVQVLILGQGHIPRKLSMPGLLLLVIWGIGVFGIAMDRHVASFVPNVERARIILLLCCGTIPFMIADSILTSTGNAPVVRRLAVRIALLASLAVAAMLDPPRLMFLLIILPVMVLFFLVHGLMGRWIGQRCGTLAAGIGLGICLAWALGVSFPLFRAG